MDINQLKLDLFEKIMECDDPAILKRVEEVFSDVSEVREGGENYTKEVDPVPASHYQKLEEDFQKYKNGDLEEVPWEKFRAEIKSNYGF